MLVNEPNFNSRIIIWLLLLQQFYLTIIGKLGKENVVADFLSRLTLLVKKEEMVDDQLPYEHLFVILVLSHWFSDIAKYLLAGWFPPNLSSKERRKFVRKSSQFTWIGGNIFRLGPNHILRRCVME